MIKVGKMTQHEHACKQAQVAAALSFLEMTQDARHNTSHHSTAQHSTAQHSTAQHSTSIECNNGTAVFMYSISDSNGEKHMQLCEAHSHTELVHHQKILGQPYCVCIGFQLNLDDLLQTDFSPGVVGFPPSWLCDSWYPPLLWDLHCKGCIRLRCYHAKDVPAWHPPEA